MPDDMSRAGYEDVDGVAAAAATARWWSASAAEYLDEHGEFLGEVDFCWCPEGLRESTAQLLGPVEELRGQRVLEVGAGAAQCSRWLISQGVDTTATDVATGMHSAAAAIDERSCFTVPMIVADARTLPFADASFDVAFTAFGAIAFVPDADAVHQEVARVLRPGGRWVFSVPHPLRWAFPDDPTTAGLTAVRSYFDRRPYVEFNDADQPVYAEYHRTVGDHIREVVGAGFIIDDIIEPPWPAGHDGVWGGWGPERGSILPGTMIFVTHLG